MACWGCCKAAYICGALSGFRSPNVRELSPVLLLLVCKAGFLHLMDCLTNREDTLRVLYGNVCLLLMVVLLQVLLRALVTVLLLWAASRPVGTIADLLRALVNMLLLRTASRAVGTTAVLMRTLVNALLHRTIVLLRALVNVLLLRNVNRAVVLLQF